MVATRAVVVMLALAAATGTATPRAEATDDPWPTILPATNAERRTTLPIAQAVISAYRSGRFSTLCTMLSSVEIKRSYGSLARCRQLLKQSAYQCSIRCTLRVRSVETAYLTARDKAQHQKTLLWLYVVSNPARSGHGELEIRCRQEGGRWLLQDVVEAWSG